MKSFLRFAPEVFRYKKLIALGFGFAILEALFSAGGFGVLMKVIEVFLGDEASRQNLPEFAHSILSNPWVIWAIGDHTPITEHLPADPYIGFVWLLGFIFLMVICGSTARFIHQYISITVCWRSIMRVRAKLFHRLIRLSMSTVDQEGVSDKISRVLVDSSTLSRGYQALIGRAVRDILQGVTFFGIALYVNWQMTLLFVVSAPMIAVVLAIFGRMIRKATRRSMKYVGVLFGTMVESLQALSVVKVYQTEGYERRRFNRGNRKLYQTETKARIAKSLAPPITDAIAVGGLIAIACIASYWVLRNGAPSEELVQVLVALGASGASFKQIARINNDIQEASGASDRLAEAFDMPVEASRKEQTKANRNPINRHKQSIVFENVSFSYPTASTPAIDGINLEIKHGEFCAIVGPNGSGKTTMLNLIPQLYEATGGRVLIDGQDLAETTTASIRKQVAVVTQKTVMFTGSIAENITYGSRHISKEKMIDAAKQSHAHEFIDQLPDGYNTDLGEAGDRLSGGQKQRIAIARAILRDPSILILDEATSQIDADSEEKIARALEAFTASRTTFAIAHRLSTVIHADKIVVMNQGKIEAIGKHEELLETCTTYQMLCRTQLASG